MGQFGHHKLAMVMVVVMVVVTMAMLMVMVMFMVMVTVVMFVMMVVLMETVQFGPHQFVLQLTSASTAPRSEGRRLTQSQAYYIL